MNSQTKTNKRILALDILRGVTIAGMIMVNNPALGDIYMPPCATLSGMASPHRSRLPFLHVHHVVSFLL